MQDKISIWGLIQKGLNSSNIGKCMTSNLALTEKPKKTKGFFTSYLLKNIKFVGHLILDPLNIWKRKKPTTSDSEVDFDDTSTALTAMNESVETEKVLKETQTPLQADNDDFFGNSPDLGFEGPALVAFGTDLTELAAEGKIEECFGREKELLEMMEILVRRQKNNPVLVGDAGVGKTAIIELFANRIINKLVPFVLEGRRLVSVDLARIVAGSRYRGEFELRLQKVLDEVIEEPNVIVFIDEIHNIGGTGSAEGSLDAANMLKPVLSRSGFQCIGATTIKEYEKIEKDPALNRRFQPIRVNEPSINDTVQILFGLRPSLEGFHNVEITPLALKSAAELSARYIYDRFLPDKAIDLVDRAAAKEVITLTSVKEGSVVSAVVNAGLTKVGNLKLEAFRRGDIPSQFVFQELENAYRNFLLRWIENPKKVEESLKENNSPISEKLFEKMKLTVLGRSDELMFSSNRPRQKVRRVYKLKRLSAKKNEKTFKNLAHKILLNSFDTNKDLSFYRINLFLFQLTKILRKNIIAHPIVKPKIYKVLETLKIKNYISKIREMEIAEGRTKKKIRMESDFFVQDRELVDQYFETLSELEEKRVTTFKEFTEELRPVLRKGVVYSLRQNSQITFEKDELITLYTLLGYFSTDTGREFLANLDDPKLVQVARKTGNFTGLKKRITHNDIRDLISSMTGIPLQSLSNEESEKLLNLENILHKRVIGQEEAINAIARAIRRSRLGIQNPNRPIASFFFCGPTGVGKTEVSKALAAHMFGSEQDMLRFDMSEFMEKFTISRLIGSPPGYVGYEEGGQLTDGVRRKPYSVVLFDEIEKAHPDVLNILLQILEDGRLTDSQKRLVPFDNTVIIMTSNAAADDIQQIIRQQREQGETKKTETAIIDDKLMASPPKIMDKSEKKEIIYKDGYAGAIKFFESPIDISFLTDIRTQISGQLDKSFRDYGTYKANQRKSRGLNAEEIEFNTEEENIKELKSAVLDRLTTMFLPEFLNRLDDIIIFQPLKPEELRKICDIMISEVTERLKGKNINLTVQEKVKNKLTREGYNPVFGARPLRRLITKYVEDLISETILKSKSTNGTKSFLISLDEQDQIIATETNISVSIPLLANSIL